MPRKADIKTCRYSSCMHPNRVINISTDDFVMSGKAYYHRECLMAKETAVAAEKEAKVRYKRCCHKKCGHANTIIDTYTEEFVKDNTKHYHLDCWSELKAEETKENEIKADIQLLKNLWVENISNTVPIAQLYRELNLMIREQGIDSKYVVFVLEYCIKNKCNLRYPGGLKYFVDRQEIKDAYTKLQAKKIVGNAKFTVDESAQEDTPKFSVSKKSGGFASILNRWQ